MTKFAAPLTAFGINKADVKIRPDFRFVDPPFSVSSANKAPTSQDAPKDKQSAKTSWQSAFAKWKSARQS